MEIPARIREWVGKDWRRHWPAAGSVAAHGVAVAAAVALFAGARPLPPVAPAPAHLMEVMLTEDSPPAPMRTPPAAPRPEPRKAEGETLPAAAPVVDPRKVKPQQTVTAPVMDAASEASTGVSASPFATIGSPRGLDGLAQADPCVTKTGEKSNDARCAGTNWASAVGTVSLMPRTKQDLKRYYSEFIPDCPFKVGCDGGEWKSNNGTRSVVGTAMAVGSAGGGGISSLAGRAIPNPDHVDPGFGD